MAKLTNKVKKEICEILSRRAGEISSYRSEYTSNKVHYGSVELALTREIDRLRDLADIIRPKVKDDEE